MDEGHISSGSRQEEDGVLRIRLSKDGLFLKDSADEGKLGNHKSQCIYLVSGSCLLPLGGSKGQVEGERTSVLGVMLTYQGPESSGRWPQRQEPWGSNDLTSQFIFSLASYTCPHWKTNQKPEDLGKVGSRMC